VASVIRSPAADADLNAIFDYVAQDNPEAARGLIRRIADRAQLHADSPLIGSPCPKLQEDLRSFVVGNYVSFYVPIDGGIFLLRVLHSARDLPRVFFG